MLQKVQFPPENCHIYHVQKAAVLSYPYIHDFDNAAR